MSKYIVGLTGGIGSGKSAAADHFNDLGIVTVDADEGSRAVVAPGQPALEAIKAHFGPDIVTADGALDRAELRRRTFADPAERNWLQKLLHPLIGQYMHSALTHAPSPYAVLVNAILFETGQDAWCDTVVVVDVPETVQVERTTQRDDNTVSEVERIMNTQMSRAERLERADHLLNNDADLANLHRQIDDLHQSFLSHVETRADASLRN